MAKKSLLKKSLLSAEIFLLPEFKKFFCFDLNGFVVLI